MKSLLNISDLKKQDILEIYNYLNNYDELLVLKTFEKSFFGIDL